MKNLRPGYDIVTFSPTEPTTIKSGETSRNDNVTSLEQISWFHGTMNRTAAVTLLKQPDLLEGTYLLRKSPRHDGFTVSVKVQDDVKHFVLDYNNRFHEYKFGNATFSSIQTLIEHFESVPILTKENSIPVTLIHPYHLSNDDEPEIYDRNDGIAEAGKGIFDVKHKQDVSIATKSGYLTKRGNIVKNWKERWFSSEKKYLRYYENRRKTDKFLRQLDISEATEVAEDSIDDKKHCFRLVFPHRTFYFVAKSPLEAKEWIDHFQWKIDHYRKYST